MPGSTTRPLKVFLCHASADKPAVRKLYRYLRSKKMDPWLDEFNLLPGQRWEEEIPKALYASDAIIVVLSQNSITKEGYVQREIKFALDKALDMPEGRIFLIPARLEECEVPASLRGYQWVDLFHKNRNRRLMSSLNIRTAQLGLTPLSTSGETQPPVENTPVSTLVSPAEFVSPEVEEPFIEAESPAEKSITDKPFQDKSLSINPGTLEQILLKESPSVIPAEEIQQETEEEKSLKLSELTSDRSPLGLPIDESSNELPQKKIVLLNPKLRLFISVAGGLLLTTLCITGGVNYLSNILFDRLVTITPSPPSTFSATSTDILGTGTAIVANTPTPIAEYTKTALPQTPTRALGIGSTFISDKDGMTLVYVPASEFTMGSDKGYEDEKPAHTVFLDAFWIDQIEVTNAMYAKCVQDGACDQPREIESLSRDSYYGNSEFDNYPVIHVTWNDAKTYCEWAGRRLPTEAEWEKAARGESAFLFPWGNDPPNHNLLNWLGADTTEVGKYPDGASPYGSLDMAGNVWEWVADWYDANYYATLGESVSNPQGPASGQNRVRRGGSLFDNVSRFRSVLREESDPAAWGYNLGFRCAMSANP